MAGTSRYSSLMPIWVIIAGAIGILTGLFFGEDAAVLRPVGSTYVKLMEISVYPYIISSLLHGLGRLAPDTAWRLFRCSWSVYLALWGITFLVIFLMSLGIPSAPPPSFIDARVVSTGPSLVDLLIPTNPIMDLARNQLPAIVIFSILYGIAIQKVKDKEAFLSFLDLIRQASLTIWNWVVLLAPLGVFALFADMSGTLAPETLASLSIYLVAMLAGTLILAFWILPSILAALLPMTTREILNDLRGALVLSVVTTLSVVALPIIERAVEKLAQQEKIDDPNRDEIVKTTVAVSYPLAQLGNFFIWLFILFAAFHFRVPLTTEEQFLLPLLTLPSGFGSPTSSINEVAFLTQWLSLPDDADNLYVGMMTITRYGQVVASVMGFAFVTFLVTMIYYGKVRIRIRRLGLSVAVGAVMIGATVTAVSHIKHDVIHEGVSPYLTYGLSPDTTSGVNATIDETSAPTVTKKGSRAGNAATIDRLSEIVASGELKVGFNPNIIPFSYRNKDGELVGLDIAYAYRLARDLNLRLRFIPFTWETLARDLENNQFNIAASGIFVTEKRLEQFTVSRPYTESPVALIVPAQDAQHFVDRDTIAALKDLTIAVFRDPVIKELAKQLFPNAKDIIELPNYDLLPDYPQVDAALWTLTQAKAWTAVRTNYTAVVPKNVGSTFLMAYLMPPNSEHLGRFIDYWLRVQHVTGFRDEMVKRWIDGDQDAAKKPRWSILQELKQEFKKHR